MNTAPSLLELQRAFVRSVVDGDCAAIAPWVRPNGLDTGERLRIYRNMVINTQTGALQTSFPTVRRLVGEACFDGMAARYIAGAPSASGNLQAFGATFASFLACQAELTGLPYLRDVAALDWARLQSYLAADAAPIAASMLSDLSEEALSQCIFAFHPAIGLIESRFPLYDIWRFCQQDGLSRLSLAAPAQSVLIWRSGTQISHYALAEDAGRFMRALLSGKPLAQALDATADAGERFDLASHLGLLLQNGLIAGFRIEGKQP
ncbi:putative DNA-binding domain-containing protein [Paludibacterium purpuratum]|uniref:Putative DNA-binding domain-containing protein n=1 Tax=Paludibacterium purpuratum TaxID=1144873 RepID=A0A4V3DUV1_9NEIS|nr:putative DNA-binding domain-containing protein [Paludibacterium purpuratum]TDR76447.1 hypothetical protein DFP86_11130 [Paludibacterium purpuratum]